MTATRRVAVPGAAGRLTPERLLGGGLLSLSALAWVVTHRWSTPQTRLGLLTGAPPEAGHHHAGHGWAPEVPLVGAGVFMAMWVVMLAAMMLPTVLPVVAAFDRWVRRQARPRSLTLVFVAGYLATWTAGGAVAYAALTVLQAWLPTGHEAVLRVGAVLFVVAGLYQFSAFKRSCLRHCRSPLAVVAEHLTDLQRGPRGAFRVGAGHGLYCAGCCWALMLVLALVGMMSVAWMGLLAAVMLAEKVAPFGRHLARPVGAALVGAGLVLVIWPSPLPALA